MRARSSFVFLALSSLMPLGFAGCTAIDNFGKFTVGDGGAAGGGCTNSCECVAADTTLGVPDHCAVTPANGVSCTGMTAPPTLMLSGAYMIDTGATPPAMTGPGLTGNFKGTQQGTNAVFCVSSLIADSTTKITVTGNLTLVIVASSLVQLSGEIRAGGGYTIDDTGGLGVAGGGRGGAQMTMGAGQAGGRAGASASGGAGGSGAGNTIEGFAGGGTANSNSTPGGVSLPDPTAGSGGGGGGNGSTKGGGGGGGGGVVQISASYMIKLSNAGIDVTGGGGAGGGAAGSGAGSGGGGAGGGGAGGLIFLDAPTVSVSGGCLSVFGGPGGDGGGALMKGRNTAQRTDCPFSGGPLGTAPAGEGGAGGFPSTIAGDAASMSGTGVGGGGGGLGSFGRVIVRANTMPSSLPGGIVFPAQVQAYQYLTMP